MSLATTQNREDHDFMFFPRSFFRLMARPLRMAVVGVFLFGVSKATAQLRTGVVSCYGPTPKQRLERIILPDVEFHQTKLSAALEFLRSEATRLDPLRPPGEIEANPAYRSLNIVFSPLAASETEPKINLTLHHIPLSEVLKYVATQAGRKVKVQPYAVSLVPLTEPDELVTATFRVAPGMFGNQPQGGGVENPLDQSAATTR